jgi:Carboxypeptidase regulatory-like domain
MFKRRLIIAALVTATICSAYGQSGNVSGTVRGTDGKPLSGAQIRFEGKDHFSTSTNTQGQYTYKKLPAGVYKISVLVNGAAQSTVTVKTASKNARVDFDLKAAPAKSVKHYVWVPPRTGSHMGGGWVQVDNSGNPQAGGSNTQTVNAAGVQDMQRNMSQGQMPPGH